MLMTRIDAHLLAIDVLSGLTRVEEAKNVTIRIPDRKSQQSRDANWPSCSFHVLMIVSR